MSLIGTTNEQKIWNYLKSKGLSDHGVAGMMGNLYAESALRPTNLQNSYEKSLGFTDDAYTVAVDGGTYGNFVKDSAGYGLAQWTYWSRKQGLLNFAESEGKSIGDLEMQLDYLYKELSEGYKSVLAVLKSATTVKAASDSVLVNFERPADMSDAVKTKRASYGQTYYDKYAGGAADTSEGGMTVKELRQTVVDVAVSYLGCKESDGSHKKIIDLYNSHKPLARGYSVKYTDAWCSTYASAVAIAAGLTDIIPTECGCQKHIELFKKLGAWVENDAYIPTAGDYIFYDWDDSGSGDNTGNADHVGIVVSVSGTAMKIIEGNISNAVGYRNLTVNAKYIRGYGVPDYESKATEDDAAETSTATPVVEEKTEEASGDVVYTVVKGDTLSAIAAKYGTTYQKLAAYNGITNPHKISVGQKIKIPSTTGSGSTATEATYSTYTVVKGDSLWAIAKKKLGNGNRYPEIVKLNGLKSNTIYAGQVLKIPAK